MKRFNYVLLLLLTVVSGGLFAEDCCRVSCTPKDSCDFAITSRSYLSVRPHFLSASPEKISGFRSDRFHMTDEGWHGAAQAVLFGSKSGNSRDLARYFFPFGKTELIVDERIALASPPLPQDLLAQHFNIFTVNGNFRSEISIRPEQSVVGVGFEARKSFCMNEEKGRGFWGSISFPVVRVKNDLRFRENIINDGGGAAQNADLDHSAVGSMQEAFMQPEWAFGKIRPESMKETGVADVELKLGYEWVQQEPFHLESYLGILVPSGNRPNGEFLFQPIVGNGKHWGVIFGNSLGIEIWANEATDRSIRMEYSSHTQYLFRNTQCRSLDLACKPWSRYIEVYRDQDQASIADILPTTAFIQHYATPGINVLTVPLKVRPGFSHNMTTAGVFRTSGWQLEGGYNLFVRQAECVKLACPWQEGPAIKYHSGDGATNPIRDITGNFRLETITVNTSVAQGQEGNRINLADYKFNLIKQEDLDLNSAVHPCTISHTIYGALGYQWDDYSYPFFVNAGGSYEFNKGNNAGIERWTFWGKMGVSF
jgi:hypothetical protein